MVEEKDKVNVHWTSTFWKHRILFSILFSLLILCSILLYNLERSMHKRVVDDWVDKQRLLAEQVHFEIEHTFTHIEGMLKVLATNSAIIEYHDGLQVYLREEVEEHSWLVQAITRMNADGIITHTYPENPDVIGQSIAHQSHVKQILNTHQPVISDTFTAVQGYRAIALHAPVMKNGEFEGSVAVLLDLERIARRQLDLIDNSAGFEVWHVTENGRIIHAPDSQYFDTSIHKYTNDSMELFLFADMLEGQQDHESNTFSYTKYEDGKMHRYYAMTLPYEFSDSMYTLFITSPEEKIFETVVHYRYMWASVIFVIGTVLVTFAYYISRQWTELKMAVLEGERDEMLARFERLSNQEHDIVYSQNMHNLSYSYVNDSTQNLTGYTKQEWMKDPGLLHNIIHPDSKVAYEEEWDKVINGNASQNFEFQVNHKEGSSRWFLQRAILIKDPEGQPDQIEAILTDITDIKNAQIHMRHARDVAERANNAKSEFLAMVSHELRTPLNPIIGFSDILMIELDDEETKTSLAIIKNSGTHLLNLINDILDVTKIESGSMMLEPLPMLFQEFLQQTIAPFHIEAENKDLKFTYVEDEFLPKRIQTDPTRLRQILSNLLSNATKFTQEGEVGLSIKLIERIKDGDTTNAKVQFRVMDTGIGVPANRRDAIFEPFTQADASMTRKFGGTGLGLTVSRRLARLMGGDLQLEEAEKGSIFTLTIMVPELPRGILDEELESLEDLNVKGRRILCVEDNEQNANVLEAMLKRMNAKVTMVTNVNAAKGKLDEKKFDLIILDIQLGNESGLDLIAHFKKAHTENTLPPVIACTANVLQSVRDDIKENGINFFLEKPITYESLAARIVQASGR